MRPAGHTLVLGSNDNPGARVGPGRKARPGRRITAGVRDPAIAINSAAPRPQRDSVHHGVAGEPVVVAGSTSATGLAVTQLTPVEVFRNAAGDRQSVAALVPHRRQGSSSRYGFWDSAVSVRWSCRLSGEYCYFTDIGTVRPLVNERQAMTSHCVRDE